MDATVQSHRADRTVHVGGVSRENGATPIKLPRNALMHGVEIASHDLEQLARRQESLQSGLYGFRLRQVLRIFLRLGWEMHAPAFRRSFPMEQVRPLFRIGDVITIRISVALEIVRDF